MKLSWAKSKDTPRRSPEFEAMETHDRISQGLAAVRESITRLNQYYWYELRRRMQDDTEPGHAVLRVQLSSHLRAMKPRRYALFQACEDEIISVQSLRARFYRQLRAVPETARLELNLLLSNIDQALSLVHEEAMAMLWHIDQVIDESETFITHGKPVPDWALWRPRS